MLTVVCDAVCWLSCVTRSVLTVVCDAVCSLAYEMAVFRQLVEHRILSCISKGRMRAGGNSASGELSTTRFITGQSAAYNLAGRNRAFDLAAKFGRLNTEGPLGRQTGLDGARYL